MSREIFKNICNPTPATENFHDDDSFPSQHSPFTSIQSAIHSPDIEQKVRLVICF